MTVGAPRSATGARCGSAPARTSVPFRRGSVFPKLLGCLALLTAAAWAQSPDGPIIDTFAGVRVVVGAGTATEAVLNEPFSVAVDSSGNLYIADTYNHRIRKVDSTGTITTVAGTGVSGFSGDGALAVNAQLNLPFAVALDGSGNLYIADTYNHRIRKVDSSGTITTVAGKSHAGFSGDGGPAVQARLNRPDGVAVDGSGNLYIADTFNHRIRWVCRGACPIFVPPEEPPPPPDELPPPDTDDDGFLDEVESGAPNNGDGNSDGVPDAQQPHVVSFPNARNSRYVTLQAPRRTCITGTRALSRPPAEPPPPEAAFPIGFLDFRLCRVGRGQTTAVTLYLPKGVEFNSYWKYGPTPDQAAPHWYVFDYDGETGARFLETGEIVLRFRDGERGDDDLRRNGEIADAGGPALTVPTPAPVTLDLPGEDTSVGMAIHNPTPAANALALSVVDAAGAALEEAAIGEPLAARGQLARSVCELIDCRHLNDASAVIARGRQGHVQSFFLAGDAAGKKLDGVSGEFETAQQLYFPIVDPGRHDATLLFVFNPTLRETAVTFTLYREDGGMVASATRAAAAGGFVSETAAGLFEGAGDSAAGYVQARAASSLLGFEFLGDEESCAALAARPFPRTGSRTATLYAPHFLAGRDSATTLYLLSALENHATRVRIRAFDNRGNPLGEAERELAGDAGALLDLDPATREDGLIEGYLQLDFSVVRGPARIFAAPQVLGAVAVAQGGARTALPLVEPEGRRTTSFLQVAHSDEGDINLFTALSILNLGPETALVRLRVFDRTGRRSTADRIFSIAAGSRRSGALGESTFFGARFRQVGGHLQVVSDRPVISFAVFGDRGGQFLAAIPSRTGIP